MRSFRAHRAKKAAMLLLIWQSSDKAKTVRTVSDNPRKAVTKQRLSELFRTIPKKQEKTEIKGTKLIREQRKGKGRIKGVPLLHFAK
jgi:hypothetical protein